MTRMMQKSGIRKNILTWSFLCRPELIPFSFSRILSRTYNTASETMTNDSTARDEIKDDQVYILSACRTPIGSYGGKLRSLTATDLAALTINAALDRAQVDKDDVGEFFMGNVLSAGLGAAPAKIALLKSKLPSTVVCTSVNKVCSSGLKAVMLGTQSIQLGINEVVVVGGAESMSNTPYYIRQARFGSQMGNILTLDGMMTDGLWDYRHDIHMGSIAAHCARVNKISREEQDNHATRSYSKAAKAQHLDRFDEEIVPITVKNELFKEDEEISRFAKIENLPNLKPAFLLPDISMPSDAKTRKNETQNDASTITAGNSSKLSDGAAMLVLASGRFIRSKGLVPLARILSYADAEGPPLDFPIMPAQAVERALHRANLTMKQIDYWEINEAFSVVAIANTQKLDINPDHVNIYGGAVALGHPLGASGARILVTLNSVLRQTSGSRGIAAICNAGGGASAVVIEKCQ